MDKKEYVIFDKTTLSDLFKDIYVRAEHKDAQIKKLVEQLSKHVNDPNTAILIVPLIAQYLEVSVRNNEQLVRLADIIQKLLRSDNTGKDENGLLTEEEKHQLLAEAVSYTEKIRRDARRKAEEMVKLKNKKEVTLRKVREKNGI